MTGDRIFGLVVISVALGFIASASQLETSFLSDPVGSKAFPAGIGVVMALCGLVLVVKPDPDPQWPVFATMLLLASALVVLIGYAYTLRPLGFLLPTALASALLGYLIGRNWTKALLGGCGVSVLLFVVFKYLLGLGLVALPPALFAG